MKVKGKRFFVLVTLVVIFLPTFLFAQWTGGSGHIWNTNTGYAGIGLFNTIGGLPNRLLHLYDDETWTDLLIQSSADQYANPRILFRIGALNNLQTEWQPAKISVIDAYEFNPGLGIAQRTGEIDFFTNGVTLVDENPPNHLINPLGGQVFAMGLRNGKVGIGQGPNLDAKFQVYNGSVIFHGTTGTMPTSGGGTRLMWLPQLRAFRAGNVASGGVSTNWDQSNIGVSSFSFGYNTLAKDSHSVAIGWGAEATGSRYGAIAIGHDVLASGTNAIAMGWESEAQSSTSIALGRLARAIDSHSVAIGWNAKAQGSDHGSIAIGHDCLSTGTDAIAMGFTNDADGWYSMALGDSNYTGSDHAIAIGNKVRITASPHCIGIGSDLSISSGTDYAVLIGQGVSSGSHDLVHNVSNSFAVGFNSSVPTFFVGPGNGAGTWGNVGVATINPQSRLDVNGNATIGSGYAGTSAAPTNGLIVQGKVGIGTSTVAATYILEVDGKTNFKDQVFYLGSLQWSDASLKQNVQTIDNALEKIIALRGVSFEYRPELFKNQALTNDRHIGFIAQEVEAVVPEVVGDGADGIKAVAYENLTALLVEAMKQQNNQVESLKSENVILRHENSELRQRLEEIERRLGVTPMPSPELGSAK
jgi:hypothetical protein